MSSQPTQSDILDGIMIGLAGIAKIPTFTPSNKDLVAMSTAILDIKTAAAKWPTTANSPVAAMVVDCYNATTVCKALSRFAKEQGYQVSAGSQNYYNSYLAKASTAVRVALRSSDNSVKATGAVFDPLNLGLDQLDSATKAIVTDEKHLQEQIQQLEHQIALSRAAIEKDRKTKNSWWFQLLSGLTEGMADAIYDLVHNVQSLQSNLDDAERALKEDLNSFEIYSAISPIASTCTQLIQCLQQWSLGFYNTVGTLQGVLGQIQTALGEGAKPGYLKMRMGQLDQQCQDATQALDELESFQNWARHSLEVNATVLESTAGYGVSS